MDEQQRSPNAPFHVPLSTHGYDDDGEPRAPNKYTVSPQSSPEETFGTISKVLGLHAQLERRESKLQALLRQDSIEPRDLSRILEAGPDALSGIREFLDSCVEGIPIRMRPTGGSATKAQKVFGTAELFEKILCHLGPSDILSAVQINRSTSGAIANSPNLQCMLHLRAKNDGSVSTLFNFLYDDREKGLHKWLWVDMHSWSDSEVSVSAWFRKYGSSGVLKATKPSIGNVGRRMLVCQPAPSEMKYWADCCNSSPHYKQGSWEWHDGHGDVPLPSVVQTITSASGITIGDMYDATMKLREEHRLCPLANEEDHTPDGWVVPTVKFEATIQLPPEYTEIQEKEFQEWLLTRKESRANVDQEGGSQASKTSMMDYIAAKRDGMLCGLLLRTFPKLTVTAAHQNGEEIPTLEAFVAKQSTQDLDTGKSRPDNANVVQ